jgi:hypothetical protein
MSNYPFLAPAEEMVYAEQKIIRTITDKDTDAGEEWKIDAIVNKLTDSAKQPSDHSKLLEHRDKIQLRKALAEAEEALKKKKQQPKQPQVTIFCIQAMDKDGMSWSSQMVYDAVKKNKTENFGVDFNVIALRGESQTEGRPCVSSVIGNNNFVNLIYKAGILKKKWLSPSAKYYIRSILALASGILGNFIFELLKSGEKNNWRLPVIIISVVVGLVIYLLLEKHVIIDPTEKDSSKNKASDLNDYLRNGPFDEKLDNLVKSVAARIAELPSPLFVVIDNYEAIDLFSRKVIDYFLLHHHSGVRSAAKEYWVIFEPQHGDTFSSRKYEREFMETEIINIHVFDQLLLSKSEKKLLIDARKLDNAAKRMNFTTAKSVCGDISNYYWISDKIRMYNNSNADKFPSRFLTLLALTTQPHNKEFSLREIKDIFSQEKIKRSSLQFYLFGKEETSWNTDYGKFMDELVSNDFFGKMVLVRKKGRNKYWQVISEMSEVINTMKEKDQVQLREAGHLFWSLYWYDKIPRFPIQSAWYKKLSYHLCELQLSGIHSYPLQDNKLAASKDDILKRLLEVYLFAVDGCQRACLILYKANEAHEEATGLIRLLNKAFDTISFYGEAERKPDLERLLSKCWELYFITLEEDLLELITRVNEELNGGEEAASVAPPIIEKVFYESLPLLSMDVPRDLLKLPSKPTYSNAKFESLYAFMQARTTWLTLIMQPSVAFVDTSVFKKTTDEGIAILGRNISNSIRRIQASNSARDCIVDFMHLSYSVWTFATFFDFFPPNADKTKDDGYLEIIKNVSQLLGSPAILRQLSKTGEYFINSLFVEIAVFNMAGLAVYLYTHRNTLLVKNNETKFTEDLNEIIKHLDVFLETKIGSVNSVNDLFEDKQIEKIDTYLEFSCLIWKRLQLDEMYNLVTVRRVHFNTVCTANKKNKRFYLSNIIGTTVNENAHSRLLVNLAKVIYKRDSAELREKFFSDAARFVNNPDNNFGRLMREEFALIAFMGYSNLSGNPIEFAEAVLKGKKLEDKKLYKLLAASANLPKAINAVYNVLFELKDVGIRQEILTLMDDFVGDLPDATLKKDIYDQIVFHRLTDEVWEVRQVNTTETLEHWKNHTGKWYYPAILFNTLNFGEFTDELEAQCIIVLSHEPREDDFNSSFKLSLLFLNKCLDKKIPVDDPNIKIAEKYLTGSVKKFYNLNQVYSNKEAYETLEKLNNENHEEYRREKNYWEEQWNEIRSLEFLINNLRQHRFCTIFLRITLYMIDCGLETVNSTKEESPSVPVALFEKGGRLMVNEEFVTLCKNIVEDEDGIIEQEKPANEVAKKNLAKLIDICFDLKSLPRQMKAILNEFRDEIDEFRIPVKEVEES